jgi:hypothetical protein
MHPIFAICAWAPADGMRFPDPFGGPGAGVAVGHRRRSERHKIFPRDTIIQNSRPRLTLLL